MALCPPACPGWAVCPRAAPGWGEQGHRVLSQRECAREGVCESACEGMQACQRERE